MRSRRQLLSLTLLWFLATASVVLAQDWFSNNDRIYDLARMAPADAEIFVGVDFTDYFTESKIKKIKDRAVTQDFSKGFLEGMESGLGYRLEELPRVIGPRAFVSLSSLDKGMPNVILGVETQDAEAAVELFRALGAIPPGTGFTSDKLGQYQVYSRGRGAYALTDDYLLVSNASSILKGTLGDGQSLAQNLQTQKHIESVSVDRGIVTYVDIPSDFDRDLKDFSKVFAGLGFQGNEFLTNLLVMLRDDSTLAPALLSNGGHLKGEAARFIPREWGFMASFHLGYLQSFRRHLKEHDPKLSGRFEDEAQEVEESLGITLDELVEVSNGEVAISSNGFRMAPKLYFGISDGHDDGMPYELTVNIGLKDPRGAEDLLRRAWKRLSLKSTKHYDDVIYVSRIGLAYKVHHDQLLMSYGKNSVGTLRRCLALKPGQSLASNRTLKEQFPGEPCIAAAYMDLRTVVEEFGDFMDLSPYHFLLRREELLHGTFVLNSTPDGLRLTGSGGAPVLSGFLAGSGFWLLTGRPGDNKAYSKPE